MIAAQGSAARDERPSVDDATWRGHSHGSERKCDTNCWSSSPTRVCPAPTHDTEETP